MWIYHGRSVVSLGTLSVDAVEAVICGFLVTIVTMLDRQMHARIGRPSHERFLGRVRREKVLPGPEVLARCGQPAARVHDGYRRSEATLLLPCGGVRPSRPMPLAE
jgi:hypothetical protein